jgi:hypothetical protein
MDYRKKLEELVSSNPVSKSSFNKLKSVYDDSISGKGVQNFIVAPIDAGLGKSISYKAYLAEKESKGFNDDESVLIIYKTKEEAKEFIMNSPPVTAKDISLYTSDDSINMLGANDTDSARVLITTHEMIRARLAKKRFESATEFFYKGKPRRLRVWDEAIAPARTIHLPIDQLVRLNAPLRFSDGKWLSKLENFVDAVKITSDGECLTIPTELDAGFPKGGLDLPAGEGESLRQLRRGIGRKVLVRRNGGHQVLIGAGVALPADLAPMIILDASARVNPIYELWRDHRGGVEFLPAATRNYGELVVHIGKTGCGKLAFGNPTKREPIIRPILAIINSKPTERWLVIGPKGAAGFSLQDEISKEAADPSTVSYLHWGVHYGTNEFADVKNVIVISAFPAPDHVYSAEYAAASGIELEKLTDEHRKAMKAGKLKDNLLQAICRGHVRNGKADVCGECNVYLLMPANQDPEPLVRETFPGCKIAEWFRNKPKRKAPTQEEKVFELLRSLKASGSVACISKKAVREKAGIGTASQLGTLLTSGLAERLEKAGIRVENKRFILTGDAAGPAETEGADSYLDDSDLARKAA